MIHCGVDIIEIDRIQKSMENPKFLGRWFTKEEQKFFAGKKQRVQTVAANFAAKEAFSKALGTGIRNFAMRDIEVLRDELGKPYINLYGKLAEVKDKYIIDISLSHNKTQAIAFVVLLERKQW